MGLNSYMCVVFFFALNMMIQGHPRTVFCETSVRRSNYCLELSIACVAAVKREREGGIWAREGERKGRFLSFLPREPNFPPPLLTPATQAKLSIT